VSRACHDVPVETARRHLGVVADRLLDLALPAACVGCGREGDAFCARCRPALAARRGVPAGLPIGLPSDVPAPLLQLEWCAPFRGPVREALHALKYAGERRLEEALGAAVAARWREAGAGGDLFVHVPVHRDRARDRGFDQAERIAIVAARQLGLEHRPVLERVRATTAQFRLDRRHRSANVAGAFRVREPAASGVARAGGPHGVVAGRWIVLVDDVVTTGSTLAACAEALLAAGALGVSAITVARER
jgi:ComF family protein